MPADSETFLGHYRKAVKTAIYRAGGRVAAPWTYPTLNDLLAELDTYSSDKYMRRTYPDLLVSPTASDRVKLAAPKTRFPEEQYNVQVDCWLWMVKHETDDNDYHLILGNASRAPTQFMTAEVSGLPASGPNRTALRKPRTQLRALVQGPSNDYLPVTPKLKVRVTGSLFYDGCHRVGQNGPLGYRPTTSWEIHPDQRPGSQKSSTTCRWTAGSGWSSTKPTITITT